MSDTELKLDEFAPSEGALVEMPQDFEGKSATDLAPVFDVPVSISAVLGRASMSVAQLLQLSSRQIAMPLLHSMQAFDQRCIQGMAAGAIRCRCHRSRPQSPDRDRTRSSRGWRR